MKHEYDRNVFQCVARGCDGCTVCKPHMDLLEVEGEIRRLEASLKSAIGVLKKYHKQCKCDYWGDGKERCPTCIKARTIFGKKRSGAKPQKAPTQKESGTG